MQWWERDRYEREAQELKLEAEMRIARDNHTPRWQRAQRTTSTIMGAVRDFVPRDRECVERMHDQIFKSAFMANVEIIEVPPECDHLDKLALEKKRLDDAMKPIMITPILKPAREDN